MSESVPDPTASDAETSAEPDEDVRLWDWVLSYSIQPHDVPPQDLDMPAVRRALEVAFNRRPDVVEVREDDLFIRVVVREASSSEARSYPYPRLEYAMKRAGVGEFDVTHYEAEPPDGDWGPWLRWIAKHNEGKL